ncbi:MAG: hypothetical protein ACRDCE_01565 [Cetobacterium sp.]|uniref:hypothetical protein n=1 Tax=Cetobacterium sp. TaxID=2071632 RepID=UPI003EE7428B
MNDMIIDTDTFDFSLLMEDTPSDNVKEVEEDMTHDEGGQDDFDLFSNEENNEDEELTEEEAIEKALEEAQDDYSKIGEKFDEIPDDVEFVVDGMKINKGQIKEVVRMNEEVRRTREVLSAYEQRIVDIEKERIGKIEAARWETSDLIEKFEQALQDPRLTNDQYRQVRENLDEYRSRMTHLNQVAQESSAHFERAQHEAAMNRIQSTVEVLRKEIPNYVEKVGPEVMKYALESGMSADELKNSMSPSLVRSLLKAKKFDEMSAKSKARAKGDAQVARSTKTSAKSSNKQTSSVGGRKMSKEKAAALKRYTSGKPIPGDMALVMEFLD